MTDEKPEKPKSPYNYPGNSKKKKDDELEKATKKVEKVISGTATTRKKSLGRKIAETFSGDDAQTVGHYILFDLAIPAMKNFISDMVSQGIDRLLFGSSRGSSRGSSVSSKYSSYNKMYNSRDRDRDERRGLSSRARATHDFDDIILETRDEAEEVIEALQALIDEYDVATVADMYDAVDITGSFVDSQWGWTDLRDVDIRRSGRAGYRIEFPRPHFLGR